MSTSATIHAALDKLSPDHLPTCPRCADLSDAGSVRCQSCGQLLLEPGASARPTLAQLAAAARERPEPGRSALVRYWLDRFTDAELAEFVAGLGDKS